MSKAPSKPYVFDVKLQTEQNTHTIEIDTSESYGWFENNTSGSGGGLWFDGKELVDFDGMGCLPMKVVRALRAAGYQLDPDCYD